MTPDPDPYRTLGLSRTASADEIRRAYRRLAKANHPDSAGDAALPRFLAIQAAYEALLGPTGQRTGARPGGAAGREPWRADPDRAWATRGGPRAGASDGAATAGGATAGKGATAGGRARPRPGARPDGQGSATAGPAGTARGSRSGTEPPRRSGRRSRASNRATPGSTTYDAAEDEPFEPEWSGGTWYGASSGTYWTINPKEYADPRKHGPEYQRRARRAADDPDGRSPDDVPPAEGSGAPEPPPAFAFDGPGVADGPTAAARPGESASSGASRASGDPPRTGSVRAAVGPTGDAQPFLATLRTGFGGRIALALVGWPPIGIAISTLAGELTGCSRFAAGCVEVFGVGTWLAQLAIIAILLALPAVAMISAGGTVAALAASVPTAVVLSATGGAREPVASAAALGFVLAVAYVVGVTFGIARRRGAGRVP